MCVYVSTGNAFTEASYDDAIGGLTSAIVIQETIRAPGHAALFGSHLHGSSL